MKTIGPKSTRAKAIFARTYARPLNEKGTVFETFENVIDRINNHQRWLWERKLGRPLNKKENEELKELREINLTMKSLPAGRILWMGGTTLSKEREIANFNCTGLKVKTVSDMVDLFWCLLNGAGVGAKAETGSLSGFANHIDEIEIIRTQRTEKGGNVNNVETFDEETGIWTIKIGDSGEAWAKSIGKILAGKFPARKLVLDFSEIRPKGSLLSRYGWVSSGDTVISKEFVSIFNIMNKKADQLLSASDINDVINHLGVIQTGRRGAEILLMDEDHPEIDQFINFKKDIWSDEKLSHRQQSNNSIMFWKKPSKEDLTKLFNTMVENGGSEPGFVNAEATYRDSPWFEIFNPCVEATLSDAGICNLVEIDLVHAESLNELIRTAYIVGRANYRQTLVDLKDGILQDKWHENNQFIRLCGVSLTGAFLRPDIGAYELTQIRTAARMGAWSMAEELGTPRPKAVTLNKPSGTLSKIMDTSAGINPEKGKYIFNWVIFNDKETMLDKLMTSGYDVIDHPDQTNFKLVKFPVKNEGANWTKIGDVEICSESAIQQLERYKLYMTNWCDMNASNTIEYSPEEVPEIIEWLLENWNIYKGLAFMFRSDPSKTAKDYGVKYLPQEVVSETEYENYVKKLKPMDFDSMVGAVENMDDLEDDCENGVCPIR